MNQINIICHHSNPVTAVTALLSEAGIDIRDINFQQMGTDSVIGLIADDNDRCLAILTEAGYSALSDETLLLRADDKPGMLATLSRSISDAGIDIRSLTLISLRGDQDIVAISTSDNAKVRTIFSDRIVS